MHDFSFRLLETKESREKGGDKVLLVVDALDIGDLSRESALPVIVVF